MWLGAGVYDGRGNPRIEVDRDKFFAYLLGPDFAGYWLYAHNGSGFDFQFLLQYLCEKKIPWTAYRTGQRMFVSACDREFFDSMAIVRGSLAKMAIKLDVETKKQKIDPEDFYPNIEHREWRPYLADDCRALWQVVERFRDATRQLGGVLRPTLASTAMCLWRAKYLEQEFGVLGPYADEPDEWRKAYYGGRVEVFRQEMGSGGSWDVNSSYPASMLEAQPCDYLGAFRTESIPQEPAIVHASVDIPMDELHPPLPVVAHDSRLWFPSGKRTGWFCSAELSYCAERYGANSVRVDVAHTFKPRDIFSAYVRDLYAQKCADVGPISCVAKELLNSLYGKTGMKRDREKIVCGEKWHDWPWDDQKALARFRRNRAIPSKRVISHEDFLYAIPERANFALYVLPQIASTVTASGRIRLQRLLDVAGSTAAYCDTDAVYADCSRRVFKKYEGKEVGQIKYEGDIIATQVEGYDHDIGAIFAAPKVYWLNTDKGPKGKAKGLRRSDAQEVLRFIKGEQIHVKRMLGIFESRRRNGGSQVITSENSTKQARRLEIHRHPDNRAFSIDEMRELGVI